MFVTVKLLLIYAIHVFTPEIRKYWITHATARDIECLNFMCLGSFVLGRLTEQECREQLLPSGLLLIYLVFMRYYNTYKKSLLKDALELYTRGIPFTYYTTLDNMDTFREEVNKINLELSIDTQCIKREISDELAS